MNFNKKNRFSKSLISFGLFFSSLFLVKLTFGQRSNNQRETININRGWTFEFDDHPGAEKFDYPDGSWKRVNLPHNFSIPYFQASNWFTGYAWYRRHLAVPKKWIGKAVFVEFEGAFRDAEIYVNGNLVGTNRSGYTGFSIDISKAVRSGDNLLAVRINNNWNAQLAPLNGDHNFTGGIYRDVTVVVTHPVHIAWFGTYVTTPRVSKTRASANVKTEVNNQSTRSATYTLKTKLVGPDNKLIDLFVTAKKIPAGKSVIFDQNSQELKYPQLWHPKSPKMYKIISLLYAENALIDRYETQFGFRWFNWTADKGFFINGEHYYFKGLNVHQDHAGWASAITNAAMVRDVQMVKDAGFDLIRGSHYPHDPAFATACDSLGILFWSENNFWGAGGFSKEGSWFSKSGAYPVKEQDQQKFEENLELSLKNMIRVNRNHPSIICWSMCNEAFFSQKDVMPKVRSLLQRLVALSHQLDPSRMTAIGGAQRGEIDNLGDIAGYNGDGARLFIDPGIPNVVSEYGSTIADRPGKYEPGYGDITGQPAFEWRSGQVMWCGFDYGTTFGRLGRMGIIDYQRLPKKAWYWYRNAYKNIAPPVWPLPGIPAMLKLSANKNNIDHADGTDDVQLTIGILDENDKEISNSPDVTLTLVSGPGEFATGKTMIFSKLSDNQILDGKAATEFRSYYAGKSVIKASSPGLKDAYISIISKAAPLFSGAEYQTVSERPYIASVPVDIPNSNDFNYALNKPTHVSSEAKGHSGRLVNDADPLTYWKPDSGKANEWIAIDLENAVRFTHVILLAEEPHALKFRLQVSLDGADWVDADESGERISVGNKTEISIKNTLAVRSIRVVFTDPNTSLSEIMVFSKR